MRRRVIVAAVLVAALSLGIPVSAAPGLQFAPQTVQYQPEGVLKALAQWQAGRKPDNEAMLKDLMRPSSMGITTPNIDVRRIVSNTPISELSSEILESLAKHGLKKDGSMTISEFRAIEDTWPLTPEDIRIQKELYPELQNVDMSGWTYGVQRAYDHQADEANLAKRFSKEQLQELADRGIMIDDTFYLFKEFHNPDNILAQPDSVLKDVIEGYYKNNIEKALGTESTVSTTGYVGYTEVDFPRYKVDWFLNAVVTTSEMMNFQADQTLRTEMVLYANYSLPGQLYTTNMWGTHSDSAGGAHEGIDFAWGTTPPVSAVFQGTVLSVSRSDQLAVYDASAYATYNYLHLSSKAVAPGSYVYPYQNVATQGNVGASSTGYHVHFEVHSGNTTGLSLGSDDYLGSITPYQTNMYIGTLNP